MDFKTYESNSEAGGTPELRATGAIMDVYLGGTVAAGDVLYFDESAEAFVAAIGDVAGTSPVIAMALEAGVAGDTVSVLVKGVVDGVTVAGSGAILYLSAATAGKMVRTAPGTTGNVVQALGLYLDGTVVFNPALETSAV
jgi:hypothetical protein